MIKGLEPCEHRKAPSQNPLLRSQWMLELVLILMPFAATNQLNYIVARWGQLVVPYILSQPAKIVNWELANPSLFTEYWQTNTKGTALQVIMLYENFKKFTKLFGSSVKGVLSGGMVKYRAPMGKLTGLNFESKMMKVRLYRSHSSQDPPLVWQASNNDPQFVYPSAIQRTTQNVDFSYC